MKSLSLLTLAIAMSFQVLSQDAVSPGYIVKNGDTLRGNLKADRQNVLVRRVSFKASDGAGFAEYGPSDLSAFRYDGGALFRTITFVNTVGANPVTETVFGQVLVTGAYSLYRVDEQGAAYYIVKKDTASWFLYDDKISGTEVVNGNYRSLLLFFSTGCDGVDQSRASFTDKSLVSFIQGVNRCQGSSSSNYTVKSRNEVHYFVYAGGLPAGDGHQLTVDAAVRWINPGIDPKASLNIGLRYSNTATDNTVSTYNSTFRTGGDYQINQTHEIISLPITFQYNFLSGRIQPAVYVGFSPAYLSVNPPDAGSSQQKFGLAVIGGACIEGYITPHFLVKADWRYELLVQYPSVGVAFKF